MSRSFYLGLFVVVGSVPPSAKRSTFEFSDMTVPSLIALPLPGVVKSADPEWDDLVRE